MRLLVVTYDVSDLSDEEIGALEGEAIVQSESSDAYPDEGHPHAPYVWSDVVDVPEDMTIQGALEVGLGL